MKRPVLLLAHLESASDKNIISVSSGGVETLTKYIKYLEENQKQNPKDLKVLTNNDLYHIGEMLSHNIRQCASRSILASSVEDRYRNRELMKRMKKIIKKVSRLYEAGIQ